MKFKYGWRPDVPDHRDFKYQAILPVEIPIPQKIDLTLYCSSVENQGTLGSCTANALVGNLEFLDKRNEEVSEDLSRLFLYFNERVLENSVCEDSGAALRDGIKTLAKYGCCLEQDWAYDISKFAKKPPLSCYLKARRHRIDSYHSIEGRQEMITCLAEQYPFVFGITVFESFESDEVKKTGIVPMPGDNERSLGGHAVMAVGYDLDKRTFLVRNSWGEKWGVKGYFTLPFDYVDNLARDFWTVRKVIGESKVEKLIRRER